MTKKTIQRADIQPDMRGRPDVSGVLNLLWEKSRHTLTDGELAGIAGATSTVSDTLEQLSTMLVDIGCVDGAASSSTDAKYGRISDASSVLFPLAEWLSAQAALLQVADHATAMLLQPSVYRKGQP